TRLLGAAETLREWCGVTLPVPMRVAVERDLAVLREHLAEPAFAGAWAEGRAMAYEQAMEYALAVMTRLQPAPMPPEIETSEPVADPEITRLTPREREVAIQVARGLSN